MKLILSLDDKIVKGARKAAERRGATLNGLVREYLKKLAAEVATPEQKARQLEALERSFRELRFRVGKRTWTRADLHERTSK